MKLRQQLLIVGLLLFVLPWFGWRYIQAMDESLRTGQAQALEATAQAVASRLSETPGAFNASNRLQPANALYAHPLATPMLLDGYANDWRERGLAAAPLANAAGDVQVTAGFNSGNYYLLLEVSTDSFSYFNPSLEDPLTQASHIVLTVLDMAGQAQRYVIYTSAPGYVSARYKDANGIWREQNAISGFWREQGKGYLLELMLQSSILAGSLSIEVFEAGVKDGHYHSSLEKVGDQGFISISEEIAKTIEVFKQPGLSLRIVSRDQWLLAHIQGPPAERSEALTPWWLRWIYRQALATHQWPRRTRALNNGRWQYSEVSQALAGRSHIDWYRQGNRLIGSLATPIWHGQQVIGAVVAEKSNDQMLALTNSAFNQLFTYSIIVTALVVVLLLAYASWLSWRIQRLNREARDCVDHSGRFSLGESWPDIEAADEIGELSRSYRDLLERLQEYTDYLRTLANKLSHELRTPIAVVKSSLENIDQVNDPQAVSRYRDRALEGLDRLGQILTAMGEASHVEASIASADKEREVIALKPLLTQLVNAYRDVYPDHGWSLQFDAGEPAILGVPELFVQMLDKLVDNATDFTHKGGVIELNLSVRDDFYRLSIANPGPLLPEAMRQQLFDSMVSVRHRQAGGTHMGLGLYIVRLIMDFHRGRVQAANLADASGVVFHLDLPKEESRIE